MENLKIAAVNFRAKFGDIESNLQSIDRWAKTLSHQNVDIALFPELSLSGYSNSKAIENYSFSLTSDTVSAIIEISQKYNIVLIVGFSELCDREYYISPLVINRGVLLGVYRKTHLSSKEKLFFKEGKTIPIFKINECTFAIQICYDTHFPELATAQALKGCDIIFASFASPRDNPVAKKERFLRFLPARAYDNSCYLISCNLTGVGDKLQKFSGVALAINPKGEVIKSVAHMDEREIIIEISGDELNRIKKTSMGYFLPNRREDLYRS